MTVNNLYQVLIDDFSIKETVFVHIGKGFAISADHSSKLFGVIF